MLQEGGFNQFGSYYKAKLLPRPSQGDNYLFSEDLLRHGGRCFLGQLKRGVFKMVVVIQ